MYQSSVSSYLTCIHSHHISHFSHVSVFCIILPYLHSQPPHQPFLSCISLLYHLTLLAFTATTSAISLMYQSSASSYPTCIHSHHVRPFLSCISLLDDLTLLAFTVTTSAISLMYQSSASSYPTCIHSHHVSHFSHASVFSMILPYLHSQPPHQPFLSCISLLYHLTLLAFTATTSAISLMYQSSVSSYLTCIHSHHIQPFLSCISLLYHLTFLAFHSHHISHSSHVSVFCIILPCLHSQPPHQPFLSCISLLYHLTLLAFTGTTSAISIMYQSSASSYLACIHSHHISHFSHASVFCIILPCLHSQPPHQPFLSCISLLDDLTLLAFTATTSDISLMYQSSG